MGWGSTAAPLGLAVHWVAVGVRVGTRVGCVGAVNIVLNPVVLYSEGMRKSRDSTGTWQRAHWRGCYGKAGLTGRWPQGGGRWPQQALKGGRINRPGRTRPTPDCSEMDKQSLTSPECF